MLPGQTFLWIIVTTSSNYSIFVAFFDIYFFCTDLFGEKYINVSTVCLQICVVYVHANTQDDSSFNNAQLCVVAYSNIQYCE